MQTPLAGEPQEARQQSAGQGVLVGLSEALDEAPPLPLGDGEADDEADTDCEAGDSDELAVPLGVESPLELLLAVADVDGEALTLGLGVGVTSAVIVTLALGVDVPWQIHWPLAGAPQERRQHRFGQDVGETLAEEDAVLLPEAAGEFAALSSDGVALRELLVLGVVVTTAVHEVLGEREGE